MPPFLIGLVAGMRSMMAPAAVSWAIHFGAIDVGGGWLAILGATWLRWTLTVLTVAELIGDQLPSTPSRTDPGPFVARLVSGSVSGAAFGSAFGGPVGGAVLGCLGAIGGTLGGFRLRARLAARLGAGPAAWLEDALALAAATVTVLLA